MSQDQHILLQQLPKVDLILEDERLISLLALHPRDLVVDEVRNYLESLREGIRSGDLRSVPPHDLLIDQIVNRAKQNLLPAVRRAVNATGVILHTALGRAPFAPGARHALAAAAEGYCTLQIDLATGKRGDRYRRVEQLLRKITGAEAAVVVNNNAAATLLVLNTFAEGKEVIVSRGELVEIGGSFRIPDVLRRSGAQLVEVGTTNRTHLKDYRNAISPETAVLLKVHQSNYKIVGFTSQVAIGELAGLAHERNLIAIDDLGSGALVDLQRWGLPHEPMPQESIAAGADLVCFSGDKLLGGPQCGIIIGKRALINQLKSNQLVRVLRCDKMTFAVLEATLGLFLDERLLAAEHPVFRALTADAAVVRNRAVRLCELLTPLVHNRGKASVEPDSAEVGSGSLAATSLPTWVVACSFGALPIDDVARRLREAPIPVIGRIRDQMLLLDCRTVSDEELSLIFDTFRGLSFND
jgi:L-seryl-tRNA(Ser) seleniumtransferase